MKSQVWISDLNLANSNFVQNCCHEIWLSSPHVMSPCLGRCRLVRLVVVNLGYKYLWGYSNTSVNGFTSLHSIKIKFRYRLHGKILHSNYPQYVPIVNSLIAKQHSVFAFCKNINCKFEKKKKKNEWDYNLSLACDDRRIQYKLGTMTLMMACSHNFTNLKICRLLLYISLKR